MVHVAFDVPMSPRPRVGSCISDVQAAPSPRRRTRQRRTCFVHRYYGAKYCGVGAAMGAMFDGWDSTGTRDVDADRFTADDFVAVSFLSVNPAPAARELLRDGAAKFSAMLTELGPDRDLADEVDPLPADWIGWRIRQELERIDGVDTTTATKLLARKRPRLRPIWDKVVAAVTNAQKQQLEPVRVALRADNKALHRRLLGLRDIAGLPEEVSALRVFDVICWREGKDRGF